LKVYIKCAGVPRELPIYEHINNLQSEHEGRNHVRRLLGTFELEGPHGTHMCLVHQPLGLTFGELRKLNPDVCLPPGFTRSLFSHILIGLHFLHQEAGIIHTGKP